MRIVEFTSAAASGQQRELLRASSDAAHEFVTVLGSVPNKPVLPTAPTSPNLYAPGPPRRHIGQPLDCVEETDAGCIISKRPSS